jgi:hypothetical protein
MKGVCPFLVSKECSLIKIYPHVEGTSHLPLQLRILSPEDAGCTFLEVGTFLSHYMHHNPEESHIL